MALLKKKENKYLNIAFTDKNDEVLRKYKKVLVALRVVLKK